MVHSRKSLQILIQQAHERGLLAAGEERYVQGALELSQLEVREIMVPRPDMHALSVEASLAEVAQLLCGPSGHAFRYTRAHSITFWVSSTSRTFRIMLDRQRDLSRAGLLRHSICAGCCVSW